MTETTSGSGTLTRPTKQSDTSHPHYFSSFQNYCCGPKSKLASSSSSNKDFLPIPEKFKKQTDDILQVVNRFLIERLPELTQFTSILPYEFFEQDTVIDSQRYLVDRIMYKMMTETRVINWMPSLKKLYPVRTSGNGNCLLHAVLIALVGVHDFNLNLRDRLLQFMDKNKEILKGSWKTERLKTDKIYGIQSEDSKLNSEWEELCDLVRYENSDDGQTTSLQFLEAVHIFSISNMLARPIIILSEDVVRNKHGEAISYNDLFGIYLPILSRSKDCVSIPIVLAYDQSHFCPLQANDKDTGTSSDNFLPLYQSIEHTKNQTLLPIRFLGNDGSPEQTKKLLQTYLNIKNLSHYPDSTSVPLTILCAELGSKSFPEKDNFFLLYYNYIVDFFETQKRKLQQEAEEEKRRREQEYYLPNQSSHDPIQRPIIKRDISSSPPPPYPSLTTRTNDNKNNFNLERRPSYDKAVTNGTAYELYNNGNRSINQYSQPPNYTQVIPRATLTNEKQNSTYQSNWEPINDQRTSNGKTINNINPTPRGNDSKLKQEQQPNFVRIPVQYKKSDPPSNLIDFDQKTDKIRPCIVCKHYFNDLLATGICADCDYNMKHRPPRYVSIVQAPLPNIYSPSQRTSDFITPLSSSRNRGPQKIVCPHCKNLNLVNSVQNARDYTCSICQTILHIPRY